VIAPKYQQIQKSRHLVFVMHSRFLDVFATEEAKGGGDRFLHEFFLLAVHICVYIC